MPLKDLSGPFILYLKVAPGVRPELFFSAPERLKSSYLGIPTYFLLALKGSA